MGFRFRKVIKLLPGVKLNINKNSTSVSVGPRGMKTTIGAKGTHNTVGIPGTGLSYTSYSSNSQSTEQPIRQTDPYSDQRKAQLIRQAAESGDKEKAYAFAVFTNLSVEELMYIKQQAEAKGKSKTLARILAVIGGPFGLQRFYVGDYIKGFLLILINSGLAKSGAFVIPWIYEIYKIGDRVDKYNNKLSVKMAEEYLANKVTN